MSLLDSDYWNTRYLEGNTGWDIGYVSTPIKEYIDQLDNKDLKILVPGAGNAHEVGYLFESGFYNTHLLDFSKKAVENFVSHYPDFPKSNIHIQDFFSHVGSYDLIIEQTFFCAIDPGLRPDYVVKCHDLLSENGKLVGLLWDDPMFNDRPPYGGNSNEYHKLFAGKFELNIMQTAYNSIPPRKGREVFINFTKLN
jgi:hypothetical protein